MKLVKCETSGLMMPQEFIDEKQSLKKSLNELIESAINSVELKENYFLVLHAKFDKQQPDKFVVSQIVASIKLPPFSSNQQVYWVSPKRGIVELLWMVPAVAKGEKLKPEFNKTGAAYLQAKGAMPK